MIESATLIVAGLISAAGCAGGQDEGPLGPDVLELGIISAADPDHCIRKLMLVPDREQSWMIGEEYELPFAECRRIQVTRPSAENDELGLFIDFMFRGEIDYDRRILVRCSAKDAEGAEVFSSWELHADPRGGPDEVQVGSFMMRRFKNNTSRFKLPPSAWGATTIDFTLEEMDCDGWAHFPVRPSRHEIKMSRPSEDGVFEVSFRYPPEPHWKTEELHCVVILTVMDEHSKTQDRHVRSLAAPEKDGRFRVEFQAPSQWIDSSHVQLYFFKRYDNCDEFVQERFVEQSGGEFGGGQWSQTGYAVIHVAYE